MLLQVMQIDTQNSDGFEVTLLVVSTKLVETVYYIKFNLSMIQYHYNDGGR